jgi:hypothetical protein
MAAGGGGGDGGAGGPNLGLDGLGHLPAFDYIPGSSWALPAA